MISCLFIPRLPVVETTNHAKPREYEKEICTKKTEDWRPNGIAATKPKRFINPLKQGGSSSYIAQPSDWH
jgi:hypothetical protein